MFYHISPCSITFTPIYPTLAMFYHVSPRSTTFALIYPQESTFYLIIPHLPWVSLVLITFTPIYPILSSCFLVDRHIREVNLVFLHLGPLNSSQSRLSLFTHTYSELGTFLHFHPHDNWLGFQYWYITIWLVASYLCRQRGFLIPWSVESFV